MEVLEGLPPDILQQVVVEADRLHAAAEVDEGLGVDSPEAAAREVQLLEVAQRRELDGGQALDLVVGEGQRAQSLIAVKKFGGKFGDVVLLQVNLTEYFQLGESILVQSLDFAVFQRDFLQMEQTNGTEGIF